MCHSSPSPTFGLLASLRNGNGFSVSFSDCGLTGELTWGANLCCLTL